MDAAFKLAANPRTHRTALGLPLQPLTIGHAMLLEEYDSAFVQDRDPELGDLVLSVFICAEPWHAAKRNLQKWWLDWFTRAWAWRCRKMDLPAETANFAEYLREQYRFPEFTRSSRATTPLLPSGCPREWALVATLMSEFGMTKREAQDTPMLEANALLAAVGEMRGKIHLKTDLQRAHWEAVKRQEALN